MELVDAGDAARARSREKRERKGLLERKVAENATTRPALLEFFQEKFRSANLGLSVVAEGPSVFEVMPGAPAEDLLPEDLRPGADAVPQPVRQL